MSSKSSKKCWVYVATYGNNRIKIGNSINVKQRLGTFHPVVPDIKLYIKKAYTNELEAIKAEKKLIYMFKKFKLDGEVLEAKNKKDFTKLKNNIKIALNNI